MQNLVDTMGLRAALLGLSIGESLGIHFEGHKRLEVDELRTRLRNAQVLAAAMEPWGALTSLALLVADSFGARGTFDKEDLHLRFESCVHWGNYTLGSHLELDEVTKAGFELRTASKSPSSNISSCLTRIVPCAFFDWTDTNTARDVCALTQAHHISYETCADWYEWLMLARTRPQDAFDALIQHYAKVPQKHVRSSEFVRDAYEAALWCVAVGSSFEDALVCAAALGDHTQAVCALAGALAAVLYGAQAIPHELTGALLGKDIILDVVG